MTRLVNAVRTRANEDRTVFEVRYDRTITFSVHYGCSYSWAALLNEQLHGRRCLLVTTPTVARLYNQQLARLIGDNVELHELVIPCNEHTKTLSMALTVAEKLQAVGLGRRDVVLALGGGVCMDIAGLAASLFRRGISVVRIPTTLIGLVDAGVGIKTAVNHGGHKSLLGSFYAPNAVFVAREFLATLPTVYLVSGLAEMAKVALGCDRQMALRLTAAAETLLCNKFQGKDNGDQDVLIRRALELTLSELVVNLDERRSLRRSLDFGHTFSPGLEAATGYRIPHGYAVAIDMALSCTVSKHLGSMSQDDWRTALKCLMACRLPICHPQLTEELCRDCMISCTLHRDGRLNLAVPDSLGKIEFIERSESVTAPMLRACIDELAEYAIDHRYHSHQIAT